MAHSSAPARSEGPPSAMSQAARKASIMPPTTTFFVPLSAVGSRPRLRNRTVAAALVRSEPASPRDMPAATSPAIAMAAVP